MKFIIQYKNQYIKVKANEKYFHIDKSYRFTSIKNMKNIINKIKEYIYMYMKMVLLVIQSTIVRYVEKNLSKS